MIITGTDIKYTQAPLPFVGQKKFYKTPFCEIIKRFNGQTVFDAFGGSGLLSRYTKDTRPDLDVYFNSVDDYCWRLSVVDDTNRVLDEMRLAGAYRTHNEYKRYSPDVEKRLKEIVEKGLDKYTCYVNLFARSGHAPRAICRTVNYSVDLCEHWFDGLIITKHTLFSINNAYDCDLYILDPPYLSKPRQTRSNEDYLGDTNGARTFCKECILSKKNIILFDEVDSDLIQLFREVNKDRTIHEHVKKYTKLLAKDMMITNV